MAIKFLSTVQVDTDVLYVDSSNNKVGIGTTTPSSNLEIVGNSGTVLDVQGSQGQLFSVTDNLTGSIFAVSDISGVPILDVNSSGLVTVDGPFTQTGGGATTLSGTLNVAGVSTLANVGYLGDGLGSVQYTLQSANNGFATIDFGDVADSNIGRLSYNHNDNSFLIRTNNATALTLNSSQNAIFEGNVSGVAGTFTGNLAVGNASAAEIYLNRNSANYINASNATGYLVFRTGGTTTALTLNATGAATFAGQITTTQNQISTNIGTTSAIRLKPGSTTNTTGKSSIFLGTSPVDNYGISLRGARLGSVGTPTFEIATHNNSANGTVALSIDNSQNATFTGNATVQGGILNLPNTSYQISGGSGVGDMRFVAPRFRFYENSIAGTPLLSLDAGNATFAGNVVTGPVLSITGTATGSPYIQLIQGGTQRAYLQYADTGDNLVLQSDGQTTFKTGGNIDALNLDSSQNAIFAGDVTASKGRFTSTGDASVGSTAHAFQTGVTSGLNIIMDNNEIMARNNGATSGLNLNPDGSTVSFHANGNLSQITDSGNATFAGTVSGTTATFTTFLGDLNGTINTATTGVTQVNAINNTTIATTAYVNNKIALIPAGLRFEGTWDASTGSAPSASPANGQFWIVSVAGSTSLSGITDWKVGDWAIYVVAGAGTDGWQKVDNSSVLDGVGTGGTVAGWSGSGTSNTLTNSPITFSGNNTGFPDDATFDANIILEGNIYHKNDTNTYFGFNPGASEDDTIIFNTAGSERMRITSAGNVGIGTTTPGVAKLSVAFNDSYGSYGTNHGLSVTNETTTGDAGFVMLKARYNNTSPAQTFYQVGGMGGGKETALGNNQWGGYLSFFTTSDGTAGAASGMFEHMRITADGNVGIGTTTPGEKLQLKGNGTYISVIASDNSNAVKLGTDSSGDGLLQLYSDAGVNNIKLYGEAASPSYINAGNLGIGTTTPNYKLTVSGGINAGGVVTYSKVAGGLDTTGYAVAGLGTVFNGASAGFTFTAYGGTGQYQKVVYSCFGSGTNWVVDKVIDEGTNVFDIVASAASAATIVFTFKTRSGSQGYSPRVVIEATGHSIISTYA